MINARGEKLPTRVVIRGLPKGISEPELLYRFYCLPPHNHFYVADDGRIVKSTRAYINFYNYESMLAFVKHNQTLQIIRSNGEVNKPKMELAPNQRVLFRRRHKPDPLRGTIETDKIYQQFLKEIKEPERSRPFATLDVYENRYNTETPVKQPTPLIKYLNERKTRKKSRMDVIFVNSTKRKPKNRRGK